MYKFLAELCGRVLRLPPPPEPPPGDEAATRPFRAAPNFFNYLILVWVLKTLGTVVGLVFWFAIFMPAIIKSGKATGFGGWTILFTALEVFGLLTTMGYWFFSWLAVRLDFDQRWYAVTDRSLRVREGVLTVREATVTFANIQNISISQGPVQRLLGIADLRVDTAGGGGGVDHEKTGRHNLHTTWFRGVDNANEIRELMQHRLRQLKDSGLGDDEESVAPSLPASSTGMAAALREVCAEARALRQAAAYRTKLVS